MKQIQCNKFICCFNEMPVKHALLTLKVWKDSKINYKFSQKKKKDTFKYKPCDYPSHRSKCSNQRKSWGDLGGKAWTKTS